MKIVSLSSTETREIGLRIASQSLNGDVYALEGELGSGKTELVRGFIAYFNQGIIVRSPSFSIVNIYDVGCFNIFHFDFFRLNDPSELFEIGFEEYLCGDGICLIEWATMFPQVLPDKIKVIRIHENGPNNRIFQFVNFTI